MELGLVLEWKLGLLLGNCPEGKLLGFWLASNDDGELLGISLGAACGGDGTELGSSDAW